MVVEELAVDGTVTSSRKLTASMESKDRRSSSSLYKRSFPSPSSVAFRLFEHRTHDSENSPA